MTSPGPLSEPDESKAHFIFLIFSISDSSETVFPFFCKHVLVISLSQPIAHFFQRRMLTEYAGKVYWKLALST